jgi:transposase-like protein
MNNESAIRRTLTVAQRAQIIQRVLVDDWSPAQAAKSSGVEERQVARWVADYRRRGMASLRADIVDEWFYRRWAGRARTMVARGFAIVWHGVAPGTCVVLPSTRDDERSRR